MRGKVYRMRYVTSRRNRDGTVRWYWQRPGFKVARLPDDEAARVRMVTQLNADADNPKKEARKGTIAWGIERWQASDKYKDLADTSKRIYGAIVAKVDAAWGSLHMTELGVSVLVEAVEDLPSPSQRKQFAAVMLNIFRQGILHDMIAVNPASGLPIGRQKRRDVIWPQDTLSLWMTSAANHAERRGLLLGFPTILYSAQRPGDVVQKGKRPGVQWTQYDGREILFRQEKTGKEVLIPVHRHLKPLLDAARLEATSTSIITDSRGLPMTYSAFRKAFVGVCAAAGIEGYQIRDLRRTALVQLAEAGCTTRFLASISGHSEKSVAEIIETYVPVTAEMARQAMALWEAKGGTNILTR